MDEVGGPTILATFTVIAALLPMAFVSGLMGPYMSPIPINASMGMLISLAIALMFTPWLSKRMLSHAHATHGDDAADSRLQRFAERVIGPFLRGDGARAHRHKLYVGTLVAIGLAVSLVVVQWVVMKMLPFDNKSEFQVVVDLPEGTALEETGRVLDELTTVLAALPEVTDYQVYAGTSGPINFNGLVRQYYLRSGPELGDIQVNLVDKHHRDRKSHEIAVAARPALAQVGRKYGASVKVVEVPPGPPVQAPLVAEIYGPFPEAQREVTRVVRKVFEATPDVVDVDDSLETDHPRQVVAIDRQKAALVGVNQAEAVQALAAGLRGLDATYVHAGRETYPIRVRLELGVPDKADLAQRARVAGTLAQRRARWRVGNRRRRAAALEHRPSTTRTSYAGLGHRRRGRRADCPHYGMFGVVGALGGSTGGHGSRAALPVPRTTRTASS